MREKEIKIQTRPTEQFLQGLPPGTRRVLVIRCVPEKLFNRCIQTLRRWNPELELTVLCHPGGEVAGCRSVVYPGEGFFRLENLDTRALQKAKFDLVALPYATNRRLSPYYQNVDRIAEAAASGKICLSWCQQSHGHAADDLRAVAVVADAQIGTIVAVGEVGVVKIECRSAELPAV